MKGPVFILLSMFLLVTSCIKQEAEPTLYLTDTSMAAGESNPDIGLYQPHYNLYPSSMVGQGCFQDNYEIDLNHDGNVDFMLVNFKSYPKECIENNRLFMICGEDGQVMVDSCISYNVKVLQPGDSINYHMAWKSCTLEDLYQRISTRPPCGAGQIMYGNWRYVTEGYIGVRVYNRGAMYGWIKIRIDRGEIYIDEIASQALRY